jgi:hypothetical protein
VYDPSWHGAALFTSFAGVAESGREYVREKSLEGQAPAPRARPSRRAPEGGRRRHGCLRPIPAAHGVPVTARKLIVTSRKNQGKRPSATTVYRILLSEEDQDG